MRPTGNGHSVAGSGWVEEVVGHLIFPSLHCCALFLELNNIKCNVKLCFYF